MTGYLLGTLDLWKSASHHAFLTSCQEGSIKTEQFNTWLMQVGYLGGLQICLRRVRGFSSGKRARYVCTSLECTNRHIRSMNC